MKIQHINLKTIKLKKKKKKKVVPKNRMWIGFHFQF